MSIVQLITNLIGTPVNTVQVIEGATTTYVPVYDTQYIVAGIILVMTVKMIYTLLLLFVKGIGGIKND